MVGERRIALRGLFATGLAGALLVALAQPAVAPAKASGLYSGPAPRPGPDILYRKPAKAPQLRNAGPWQARPILVSGASAYRKGEFLYQDFIYDDHGAQGTGRDPNDPRSGDDDFSQPNGTYTYPSDRRYGFNAADLVEFRVKPLADATAFRITLNTMKRPGLVGTTIALGESPGPQEVPHGANATAPARYFLTVHGHHADLVDTAATGKGATPTPTVDVSRKRNQIDVRVPHGAWNPQSKTVPMSVGAGLWDKQQNAYLIPGPASSETEPGGAVGLADPTPTAFFNVGFRFDEPFQQVFPPEEFATDPAWWRDKNQGEALKTGDLGAFTAEVDFGKLAAGTRDDMHGEPQGVPTTGAFDRIMSSHFRTGEGANWNTECGEANDCVGELRGRLQPYAIYVPDKPTPSDGYGLTLLLHSLGANYNQFAGTNNQSQLGDRGAGSIVLTASGRGPDGWYWGHAGADTFEMWADAAKHYPVDPDWTAISGYSMGGYATFKFATQFPDLFAKANPVVGPPGLGIWVPPADPQPGGAKSNTNRMLESVRHIPFLIWNGTIDELVPVAGATAQAQTFDDLGYRYIWDLFTTSDHFALAVNDEFGPAADFLGAATVKRNPAHVSYVVNPKMDFANVGTVADHAYWLSGLRLRDASSDDAIGKVDAISHAFGKGDPTPSATQLGGGTLTGGNLGPLAYTEESKSWGDAPDAQKRDRLDLDLTNLDRVVVHTDRAKLSCDPDLDVTTDGPVTVVLAGCGRQLQFP